MRVLALVAQLRAEEFPGVCGVAAWCLGRRSARPAVGGGRSPGAAGTGPHLALIADGGADAFYRGPIAAQLVAEMHSGGGLITKADLAGYQARVRPAIHGTYRRYDIYGAAAAQQRRHRPRRDAQYPGELSPSQWGAKTLNGVPAWSPQVMHVMIEAMRRAYCDRARWLGDPEFASIPPHLTSKEYARQLAAGINLQRASRSDELAPEITLASEPSETTHFSVVDGAGMAVANTYTLERSFGSKVVVRGAGFALNNQMTDFNRIPGRTDRSGQIGTPANMIAPGKRMLSGKRPRWCCATAGSCWSPAAPAAAPLSTRCFAHWYSTSISAATCGGRSTPHGCTNSGCPMWYDSRPRRTGECPAAGPIEGPGPYD